MYALRTGALNKNPDCLGPTLGSAWGHILSTNFSNKCESPFVSLCTESKLVLLTAQQGNNWEVRFVARKSSYSENWTSEKMVDRCPKAVVPNLLGTRDQFCRRQFIHELGVGGMVSRWFKHITFIVHFISKLMNAATDLTGGTSPLPGGWGPLS